MMARVPLRDVGIAISNYQRIVDSKVSGAVAERNEPHRPSGFAAKGGIEFEQLVLVGTQPLCRVAGQSQDFHSGAGGHAWAGSDCSRPTKALNDVFHLGRLVHRSGPRPLFGERKHDEGRVPRYVHLPRTRRTAACHAIDCRAAVDAELTVGLAHPVQRFDIFSCLRERSSRHRHQDAKRLLGAGDRLQVYDLCQAFTVEPVQRSAHNVERLGIPKRVAQRRI